MKSTLSARARLDIRLILSTTGERFGHQAQRRYRVLLAQAIKDVAADPSAEERGEAMNSRDFASTTRVTRVSLLPAKDRVGRPRHVISLVESSAHRVSIRRILHDAMDLPDHLKDV